MTTLEAAAICQRATRCTQASLLAFGINAIPQRGSGCLEYLRLNGFKLNKIATSPQTTVRSTKGLKGRYLILVKEHAIALIDGVLIDTMHQGFDQRAIEYMWEVTR